jgi:hypothetical protein
MARTSKKVVAMKAAAKHAAAMKAAGKAAAKKKPVAATSSMKVQASAGSAVKKTINKKDKADAKQHLAAMSLEEKLELWRKKQDFEAPLDLDTAQQKQLASKFKTALVKAGPEAKSVWSDANSQPAGLKLEAKQLVVKSWVMDKTWGQAFKKYTEKIEQDKSFKKEDKPVSMMELQRKYTDAEIQDLLETGGITECRHSSRGRVRMYLDHSNWAKTTSTHKVKSLEKYRVMEDDEDDADGGWDGGFGGFNVFDEDQAGSFFLGDDPSILPLKGKGKGKGDPLDFEDDDKAYKAALQAAGMLNSKRTAMECIESGLKKNSLYERNMQKKTKNILDLITTLEAECKNCYMQKKIGKGKVRDMLERVQALLKDYNSHATILRKL